MIVRTRPQAAHAISLLILGLGAQAFAQFRPTLNVNCSRGESLASVVAVAYPDTLINIKGACAGPISINTDGLQLNANGVASIHGAGKDEVAITGAQRVILSGLTITGGANGIVAQSRAQVILQNDTVSTHTQSGIVAVINSAVTVSGGASHGNSVHGLDIEAASALVVTGTYAISGNGVFGINVKNGSSLTLTRATVNVTDNVLGIQMGTNASGFLDGQSFLNASQNASDGMTIVSGSHLVDFGGRIQAISNGIHRISLNSKAGLDLDAGSQVLANDNLSDGVHLEQGAEMTIFNNPEFSGNSGITTLTVQNNQANGINVLTGSQVLDDNYAIVVAQQNRMAGISIDNGSSVTFGKTIPVNSAVQSFIVTNNPPSDLVSRTSPTTTSFHSVATPPALYAERETSDALIKDAQSSEFQFSLAG